MNRADFYLLQGRFRDAPLDCICALATRAYRRKLPTLVLCNDLAQAEALDQRLWEFDPDLYLPHQIAGDEDDAWVPLLLVPPGTETPLRDYIINLRPTVVASAPARVAELIIDDAAGRSAARERWRQYQALDFELHKHDL